MKMQLMVLEMLNYKMTNILSIGTTQLKSITSLQVHQFLLSHTIKMQILILQV